MSGVGELGLVQVNDLSSVLVRPSSVVPQRLNDEPDVDVSGEGIGLPVVERLERSELVGVLLDEIGELAEDLASRGSGAVLSPNGLVRRERQGEG